MKKQIAILFLLFFVIGCQKGKKTGRDGAQDVESLLPLDPVYPVKQLEGKSVLCFSDLYPVELDFYGSSLYVVTVKSDTSVYVYDRETYKPVRSFGLVGSGPQDVHSPELVSNNYELKELNGGLIFRDMVKQKLFRGNAAEGMTVWEPFANLKFATMRGVNISGGYWIGQETRIGAEKMFHIYNATTGKTTEIEYFPVLANLGNADKNMVYALNIMANRSKDRIVASMYFFDWIQIYNFEGERVASVSLSPGFQPEQVASAMKEGKDYISYPRVYATADYCYLCRELMSNKGGAKASQLVRMDWNGKIEAVYQFDEPVNACCVDEQKGEIYTISTRIDPHTEEEFYDIRLYSLPA